MLPLDTRLNLLTRLGAFLQEDTPEWEEAKARASRSNAWFTPENIALAATAIAVQFLDRGKLDAWVSRYRLPEVPRTVGIVMAGNLPLVGFHDFLCGFVAGHRLLLKLSSKDAVLLPFLLDQLRDWEPGVAEHVQAAERLNGCDAYIATGSNNSARYFEQYFGKYPHLIRRSRTSVALLRGDETADELSLLADDVFQHFGLGCRNVTQLHIPEGYDFGPLLDAFKKYEDLIVNHKYKNNYDYHLALYLLNRVPYKTNESVLLVENDIPFSAVATVHYRYYTDLQARLDELRADDSVQTVVGREETPLGTAQRPALTDYADGVDTMAFLCAL